MHVSAVVRSIHDPLARTLQGAALAEGSGGPREPQGAPAANTPDKTDIPPPPGLVLPGGNGDESICVVVSEDDLDEVAMIERVLSIEPDSLLPPQEEELLVLVVKDADAKNFRDHCVYTRTSVDSVPDAVKVIDTRWFVVLKEGGARLVVEDSRGSGPRDPDVHASMLSVSFLSNNVFEAIA